MSSSELVSTAFTSLKERYQTHMNPELGAFSTVHSPSSTLLFCIASLICQHLHNSIESTPPTLLSSSTCQQTLTPGARGPLNQASDCARGQTSFVVDAWFSYSFLNGLKSSYNLQNSLRTQLKPN
ncbi:hypothetical protein Ae201684P_017130 [Aphanomyces euteiches]|uniref:Uncharacterized protein n=1 Tax=Aphanomyces euteiches TaxID=100861 RepID=A0A6G0W7G9_9STRA|nr:hypothetical protein Ae201684_018689 [Aphanomyces euteiches]KAH9088520.1 hypothetical protein Ae201684P_017130 [Aphanomyces euteiches]